MLTRHYEISGEVAASAVQVFEQLDDHARLSAHMSKPSWKMGGGSMQIHVDEQAGKSVGSHIRLAGRIFGLLLSVDEVVTEREPPFHKTWETVGVPRLLVIGGYRLGFVLTPMAKGSVLRVFIDYEIPKRGISRVLGLVFANAYARWCVRQMIHDVTAYFASTSTNSAVHV